MSIAPTNRSHEARLGNTPTTRLRRLISFISLSSILVEVNLRRWYSGNANTVRQSSKPYRIILDTLG